MSNLYCNSCNYGFTVNDISLECEMLGYTSCPECNSSNEIPHLDELSVSERKVIVLTEQVDDLNTKLTYLSKHVELLTDIINLMGTNEND